MKKIKLLLLFILLAFIVNAQKDIIRWNTVGSNIQVVMSDTTIYIPIDSVNTASEYDNYMEMLQDCFFNGDSTMTDAVYQKAIPKYNTVDRFVCIYETVNKIIGITDEDYDTDGKFDAGQLSTYNTFRTKLENYLP